jgi:hypothetical protein
VDNVPHQVELLIPALRRYARLPLRRGDQKSPHKLRYLEAHGCAEWRSSKEIITFR